MKHFSYSSFSLEVVVVLSGSVTLYPAVMLPGISQPQNSQELRKLREHITGSHILNSLEYVITGHILYICCLNNLIFLLPCRLHSSCFIWCFSICYPGKEIPSIKCKPYSV